MYIGTLEVRRLSSAFNASLKRWFWKYETMAVAITAERLNRLSEASAETGVGLAGMRERMHELNGQLEIDSDGHGTTLRAILPRPARTRSDPHPDGAQVALSSVRTEIITSTDRPTFQNQNC